MIDTKQPAPRLEARLHLGFLDGLRGLAALYVVLFHVYYFVTSGVTSIALSPRLMHLTRWMGYGHSAVDIFIVLSGFSLMLPVARSRDGNLAGGIRGFLVRRSRRILPPYYAALALSIGSIMATHWLRHVPVLDATMTPGNILAHVFLVHNLWYHWVLAFDTPLWSVATEWQIYFLFPLLLLPIWRRFGATGAVIAGFAVGLLPILLLPAGKNLSWMCPWYLGLFAIGLAAAVFVASFSPGHQAKRPFTAARVWAMAAAVMVVSGYFQPAWLSGGTIKSIYYDVLVGLMSAGLITDLATPNPSAVKAAVVRLLESRPLAFLGAISYSLYLIHDPLLDKSSTIMLSHHMAAGKCLVVLLSVGVPCCLIAAYLFHLIFERPFMSKPAPRTERQAEVAAITNPAP